MPNKQMAIAAYVLVVALTFTACFKSKIVAKRVPTSGPPLNPSELKVNGVTYALPRTVVKVSVPVTMASERPGELEIFAPCFFSEKVASKRITADGTSFSIEPPTFSTRGEPDPNQHFIVKTKGGYFEHKSMLLEYTPEGVLTKGDAESKDESLEFAVATAKTIVSIAAKAATPAGAAITASPTTNSATLRVARNACRALVAADRASFALDAVKAVAKAAPPPHPYVATAQAAANAARADAAKAVQELSNLRSGLTASAAAAGVAPGAQPAAINVAVAAANSTAEAAAQEAADDAIVDAFGALAPTTSAGAAANAAGANSEAKAAGEAARKLSDMKAELGAPNPFSLLPIPPPLCPAGLPCVRKPGVPSPQFVNNFAKAVEVNDAIKRLQGQRDDLVSGVGGTSAGTVTPETLNLMLKETDDTIEAYQNSYFLGTTVEKSWTGPFEFTPTTAGPGMPSPAASGTLFLFDEDMGLCEGPVADALGIKIPKKFKPKAGCAVPPAGAVAVTVKVDRKGDDDGFLGNLDAAHARDEARERDRGFYYRVPAKGSAILLAGAKELARSDVVVAQFGIVASLPASSSGRTTQYTVNLDDSTGALKNFKLGSDSLLQKSLLDDAASSANAIIDAKKARDKKKADESDELAKKKRELDLLKTQNDINTEKKKLEGAGPQQ